MSTLKEMAVEYREAAAKMRVFIKRREEQGADDWELKQHREVLRQLRDTSRLLSGYYDVQRYSINAAVGWLVGRAPSNDH